MFPFRKQDKKTPCRFKNHTLQIHADIPGLTTEKMVLKLPHLLEFARISDAQAKSGSSQNKTLQRILLDIMFEEQYLKKHFYPSREGVLKA